MHVAHIFGAAALMQIVNVLRHQQGIARELRFQSRKGLVRRVGLDLGQPCAPLVIEAQHQVRIARKTLWRCHVIDRVVLPQTARVAKGIDPTFRADAGSGQDDNALWFCAQTRPPHGNRLSKAAIYF